MRRRSFVVLELSVSRVAALEVRADREGVHLVRAVEIPRSATPHAASADEFAPWCAAKFREAGIGARQAVVALDRGEVIVKHLRIDGAGIDEGDLPGMVRLQMLRQLTFHPDDAAIDFSIEASALDGASQSYSVAAAALPGERMAWIRQVLRLAGFKPLAIALKTDGVGALMRTGASWRPGIVLAIAFGRRGADFVLIDSGRVISSRGADVVGEAGEPGNDAAFAAWVATEARRTWMSHTTQASGDQIDRGVVIGAGSLASLIADRCAEALGVRVEAAGAFAGIDSGDVRTEAWMLPLAGLAYAYARGETAIDLANPKKPPDRTARKRQLGLAAVFAVIVAFGWLFTQANLEKGRLEPRLEALREELAQTRRQQADALRAEARLEHLNRWRSGDVSWIDHLAAIVSRVPSRERVLLTSLGGAATTSVDYSRRTASGEYSDTKWSSGTSIVFSLAGKAVDRATADSIRGSFVSDPLYVVEPRGRDTEAPRDGRYAEVFAMILRSATPRPARAEGGSAP